MSYVPTNWVNGVTPINEGNLNKMEQGILEAHETMAEHDEKIDMIAREQIPTEYVKEAVDKYVEENSAGFVTQENLTEFEDNMTGQVEEIIGQLSSEIADCVSGISADITPLNNYAYKRFKSVRDNVGITLGGYLNSKGKVTSDFTDIETTDYIKLSDYPELYITGSYTMSTAILALYDADKKHLFSLCSGLASGDTGYNDHVKWVRERFTIFDALTMAKGAVYLRISSYHKGNGIALNVEAIDAENSITTKKIMGLEQEVNGKHTNTNIKGYASILSEFEITTKGYLTGKSGNVLDTETLTTKGITDYIKLANHPEVFITGTTKWSSALVCIYDNNYKHLGSVWSAKEKDDEGYGDVVEYVNYRFTIFDALAMSEHACYMRISSFTGAFDVCVAERERQTIDSGISENVLHGKKWVACGDSYTEGDFTGWVDENGKSGKNSPVIYDGEMGMYKTYPWWIAKRNGMTLVNEAKCGSDFTNIEGASNPFSVSRYLNVPADADYITLMFGLNETAIGNSSDLIGTKDDTTNTTLWGAYNIVFEHFLTNMPYAKIGVIIPDAWCNANYANAVIDICCTWAIFYYVLKIVRNNSRTVQIFKGVVLIIFVQFVANLFNLNITKKEMARAMQQDELLDLILQQASERLRKRPDELSTKDLLDYMNAFQSNIEKNQTYIDRVEEAPAIQYNDNKQVVLNIGNLTRDESENVIDFINDILKSVKTEEIKDVVETVDVTKTEVEDND